jgi:hypothetical protein
MRETFKSWYPITETERSEAYRNGHVVLDTSVLLSLYRLTTITREDILNLLEKAADRLWMPHQVGLEFHSNRLKVIDDTFRERQALPKAFKDARKQLHSRIKDWSSRTWMETAPLDEAVEQAFNSLEEQVAKVEPGDALTLEAAIPGDSLLDALADLYRDRVGEPFTEERLKRERSTGLGRIEGQVPPGYEDAEKGKGDPLGDYFIWRQVLDRAVADRRPVLFVTEDQKPDLFWKPGWARGRTIGPRQELVEEMFKEADVRLHLVTLKKFLREAPAYLDTSVREDTVLEAEHLPPILDAHIRNLSPRNVLDVLHAKNWPVHGNYVWHDLTGLMPSLAHLVRFRTGSAPNDPDDLIVFEYWPVPQWSIRGRSLSSKIADLMRRFSGPIVVVTPSPAPVLLPPPGGQPAETYHCGWGEFPRVQLITLEDLAAGAYNLPVLGIQEVNE